MFWVFVGHQFLRTQLSYLARVLFYSTLGELAYTHIISILLFPPQKKSCLFLLCFTPEFSGLFAGHDPTRGSRHDVFKMSRVGSGRVGSENVQNVTGRVGSGQEVFKSRGSGQVGSRFFQISQVGSGRVASRNFHISWFRSGQVGSRGDEQLGSGHVPRETGHSQVGPA